MGRARRSSRGIGSRGISILSVALFFLVWEITARTGIVSPVLTSSPTRAASACAVLVGSGALSGDLTATLIAFSVSLVGAAAIGGCLGLLVGVSEVARAIFDPFITAANALPKVVLMPIVVLWVGIGAPASIVLGTFMASFPIIVSMRAGVRALDDDFTLVARAFGASWRMRITSVVLPGVAPYALAGLRVGVNYAMVGVLISEFFASGRGLGHRMIVLVSNFEIDAFFGCLILVAAFVLVCSAVVHRVERRAEAWRRDEPIGPGL